MLEFLLFSLTPGYVLHQTQQSNLDYASMIHEICNVWLKYCPKYEFARPQDSKHNKTQFHIVVYNIVNNATIDMISSIVQLVEHRTVKRKVGRSNLSDTKGIFMF